MHVSRRRGAILRSHLGDPFGGALAYLRRYRSVPGRGLPGVDASRVTTPGIITRLLAVERVPPRARLVVSLVLGLAAGAITVQKNVLSDYPRDFGQVWFAARAVLRGVDPYPLYGLGREYDWPWPLLYPMPAAVAAIPFAPFPMDVATVLFTIIGGACLAWALMEYGYGPAFGFFAASVRYAAEAAQYSPLLAGAFVIAPLSALLIVKPTIGAAIFVARPSWWAVGGAVALALISFAVQPTWIHDWMAAVASNNRAWLPDRPYRIPVTYPGGILALLSLLRWRRPEARLVAALACVPQTPAIYETAPLLLVPRTFWEAAALVALSYVQHLSMGALVAEPRGLAEFMDIGGRLIIPLIYLPVTLMILRRPNEGAVPAWLERRVAAWPTWIRGAN